MPPIQTQFPATFLTNFSNLHWLWLDDFATNYSAGSLNNTPCEPGPYTRQVTDTALKASTSGGDLIFASGGSGYGNPGYWCNQTFPRTAGLQLVIQMKHTSGAALYGWAGATSGLVPAEALFFFSTTDLRVYGGGSGTPNVSVGTIQANTEYNLTIIRRSGGGAFYFIQGGAFVQTELVYASRISAVVNAYPAMVGNNTVSRAKYLAIPVDLYVPSAVASDSFTRSNGALGSTNGLGHPDGISGNGLAWVDQIGTWAIASNKAQASALSGGIAIATVDTGKANILNERLILTRAGGIVGGVYRYVDANNYIYAGHDGTNAILVKRVAGVETTVATAAVAFGAGQLDLTLSGTMARLWWNNTLVQAEATIGDAVLQSSTLHGLYSTNTGNTHDDFVVWPRGS